MSRGVTITLDVSGLDRFKERAADLIDQAVDATARSVERAAKESMQGGGSPHVPSAPGEPPAIDTGTLRASIHVEEVGPCVRTIGDSVEYGIHLEFGTSRMAARPWLIPALESERDKFAERVARALQEAAA